MSSFLETLKLLNVEEKRKQEEKNKEILLLGLNPKHYDEKDLRIIYDLINSADRYSFFGDKEIPFIALMNNGVISIRNSSTPIDRESIELYPERIEEYEIKVKRSPVLSGINYHFKIPTRDDVFIFGYDFLSKVTNQFLASQYEIRWIRLWDIGYELMKGTPDLNRMSFDDIVTRLEYLHANAPTDLIEQYREVLLAMPKPEE